MLIPDTIINHKTANTKVAKRTLKLTLSDSAHANMVSQTEAVAKLFGQELDPANLDKAVSGLMERASQMNRGLLDQPDQFAELMKGASEEKTASKEVIMELDDATYNDMTNRARQMYQRQTGQTLSDDMLEEVISGMMEQAIMMGEIFTPQELYPRGIQTPMIEQGQLGDFEQAELAELV